MKPVSLNEHKEEEIIKYPKRLFIGFEKGTEKSDYEAAEKLAINYVKDNFSSRRIILSFEKELVLPYFYL